MTSKPKTTINHLATTNGVERIYGIPHGTLLGARNRGELAYHELACGTVVYDRDDVEEWIDHRRKMAESTPGRRPEWLESKRK